ncbi:protein kinase [Micromonospora sp. NPDC050397]|uniref:protein kinase domain-containing protein n=1 Tax=Micromonospora sp. NPDC050397 TaxID=3364279 RepID=UPI00384B0D9D
MRDAPRQLIANRYRLVQPLGQGGMGRVWQARDEMLERDVAIKELVPPPGLTDDERHEMRERSMREARAVARLDQVNVVRVYDVVHTGDDPWIVMELVQSRSLHQVLQAEGAMAPERVAQIGLGVLAALRAAHRAGVLHRDVKPANVLLADDGRVVLTDFGLATVPGDPHVTRTGIVLGSPAYLAPERATDGLVGPAADLWSLGATLYAAVEGRTPYNRSSAIATLAALATELPPPPQRAGSLTVLLEGLLRRDPEQRIGAEEAERLLRLAGAASTTGTGASTTGTGASTTGTGASTTGAGPSAGAGDSVAAGVRRAGEGTVEPSAGAGTDPATPPRIVPEFLATAPRTGTAATAPEAETADPTTGSGVGLPTRGRARRSWLVASLTAALLLVLVVSVPLVNGKLFGGHGGKAGSNQSSWAPTSPPGLEEASIAQVVPPPATGWHYYRDDPDFSVPVPDGWQSLRDGDRIEFREPDGMRVLGVDEPRSVKPDLVAQLRARERAERDRYPDYRQVRIRTVAYHVRAAEWEWTYTAAGGERMHAISRTFVSHNGRPYAIGWTTPDGEWSTNQGSLSLVLDGFQGTPPPGSPAPGGSAQPGGGQPNPGGSGVPGQPGTGQSPPPGQSNPTSNPANPGQQPQSSQKPPAQPAGNEIISLGSGRCIDIPNSAPTVGVQLQMWDCHQTAGQLFTFPSDGTVRSVGKCLDVQGRSTSDGAAVVLADCNGGASQKFTLNRASDLVNVRSDRCVDVIDAKPGNGVRLQIWQCSGTSNQKWRLG